MIGQLCRGKIFYWHAIHQGKIVFCLSLSGLGLCLCHLTLQTLLSTCPQIWSCPLMWFLSLQLLMHSFKCAHSLWPLCHTVGSYYCYNTLWLIGCYNHNSLHLISYCSAGTYIVPFFTFQSSATSHGYKKHN